MKIDSTNPSQRIISPEPGQAGKPQQNSDFAEVLKETVQSQHDNQEIANPAVKPTMAYMAIQQPARSPEARRAAQGLLDDLERYQRLLADPGANMKTLDPMVDNLKKHAEDIEPVMESLPGDDPVRGVIEETMMLISKEIERFYAGVYIDP